MATTTLSSNNHEDDIMKQKKNLAASSRTSSIGNFRRKKTDYIWLASFFLILIAAGEYFYPERSNEIDRAYIQTACNPLGLSNQFAIWGLWAAVAVVFMYSFTVGSWLCMRSWNPAATPSQFYEQEMSAIRVNMVLLGSLQAMWDMVTSKFPISKVTSGNLDSIGVVLRDAALWMLCFELAWYTQHRLMHDVKFLWTYGHAYHHTWKRPAHMIGITNFAFDHVVEIFVTLSSSFIGYVIFPANFYVGKAISMGYMVLAVLVHWDGFSMSRYHINHHYLVTKNYGSHIPVFDIFFGTYQWESYEHPESLRYMKKEE